MAPPGGSSGAGGDFATTGIVKLVEGLGEASYAPCGRLRKIQLSNCAA